MDPRHEKFCQHYLVSFNATDAARQAGYSEKSCASLGYQLLRRPDGSVEVLDRVTGLLVGVDVTSERESVRIELPVGSTLIGYTDGLIEHPGADLDAGIAALVQRLRDAPVGARPADLCAHAIAATLDRRDDIALIAVQFE